MKCIHVGCEGWVTSLNYIEEVCVASQNLVQNFLKYEILAVALFEFGVYFFLDFL